MRGLILFAVIVAIATGTAVAEMWSQPHGSTVTVDNRPIPRPAVGDPVRISIPAVGIDSRTVVPVGVDHRGAVGTPCDPEKPAVPCNVNATGWYNGSPRPGSPGNAIIDGHVDWYGPPPTYHPDIASIFTNLHRVKVGQQVMVADSLGHTRTFVVDSIETLPYPQTPGGMFATSGKPSVTLVTCAGVFASVSTGLTRRLYVHATLANA